MQENKTKLPTNTNTPGVGKYYESVAIAFRYAKFIVLFFTIIFLMVIMSFYRDEISVDNFQYMIKYISNDDDTLITTKRINYPTSDSKALDLFAGDFASAGSGGITLYDTNGNTVLSIDAVMSEPVFSTGKKFALCYDLSGYNYVIFNTFSKLYQEELDFPISAGVIDNKGNFAILTKDKEYKTVINVHDSDFDIISRVYKDAFTFDLDINDTALIYSSARALDSRFITEVSYLKHKSSEETVVATLYDEFPIRTKFSLDNFYVLTDKSLYFFDSADLSQTATYSFMSRTPKGIVSSDRYVMIYFEKNMIASENEIKMYTNDGRHLFTCPVSGKISSVDINEEYAIIHTSDTIYRIDISANKIEAAKVDSGADKALLQSDSSALVCYKNYARLIDFTEIYDSRYIDITKGDD